MKVIAITKKGLNKTENEDRIVVGKSVIATGTLLSEIDEGIVAVADGVGGNNAGAVASHFVASRLCVLNSISNQQLQMINSDLLLMAKENEEQVGMATTLSGVSVSKDSFQLFSVGNTRVYLLQSGKYLKQLTTDDTTLNYLLSSGIMSSEDAKSFDRKNEITACFGGGNPNLFKIELCTLNGLYAPVMITSDGIHDYLSVDEMEDIIEKDGLTVNSCEEMIRMARENGSTDDVSLVLVWF